MSNKEINKDNAYAMINSIEARIYDDSICAVEARTVFKVIQAIWKTFGPATNLTAECVLMAEQGGMNADWREEAHAHNTWCYLAYLVVSEWIDADIVPSRA